MDILLPEDTANALEYYSPKRPSSATCAFKDSYGNSLATPAATVDPLSATISSVTDSETIVVSIGAGSIVAGRWYWWVSADGQESRVLVSQVDSTTIKLAWPVARNLAEANDTLKGARITATATTTATATRGTNYAIEWTTTHADTSVLVERQVAHVVRCAGRPALDVGLVKNAIATWWPDIASSQGFGYFWDYTRRANDRWWRRFHRTGRFLHLLWNASDFEAAGRTALEIELAIDKLIPADVLVSRTQYIDDLMARLDGEIDDVVSSRPYDEGDQGSVDLATETRSVRSIALARV